MKKVLIVIPTNNTVMGECYAALLRQDYPNFTIMVHAQAGKSKHKSKDSTANRNEIRKMALASDATHFLFVDSDTVLPPHALTKLMSDKKDIVGGWYKIITDTRWVAGYWKDKQEFINYLRPQSGVIKVDMAGLGCLLISRKVLEKTEFNDGTNMEIMLATGARASLGPCGQFGLDAKKRGFQLFMDGDVICKHLNRNPVTRLPLNTNKYVKATINLTQ